MKTKTIVLIHGMFMNPLCWEKWIRIIKPKDIKSLRRPGPDETSPLKNFARNHPDSELAKLKLGDVVDHLANAINGLSEKPAIIGHSMGGLVVQLLLQRDLAVAGVAIDPAPPAGVFTTAFSFLKANFPAINPFLLSQPMMMTFEQFQYAFVNTLPLDEQRAAYDRYAIPESRGLPTSSLGAAGRIDFKKPHPPLLITAGEKDHIVPASLNKSNFIKYQGIIIAY